MVSLKKLLTNKKIYWVLLNVLIILAVLFLVIHFVSPPAEEMRTYTIHGSLEEIQNSTGLKPARISAYYPVSEASELCSSERFWPNTNIDWIYDTGKYTLVLIAPVGLGEVYITTNCASGNYTSINLIKPITEVTVFWGHQINENTYHPGYDVDLITARAGKELTKTRLELDRLKLNESYEAQISSHIVNGQEELLNIMDRSNEEERLLHAYYAEWFSWKAQLDLKLVQLMDCVQAGEQIINKTKKDPCYVPPHDEYSEFNDSKIDLTTSISMLSRQYPAGYNDGNSSEFAYEVTDIRQKKVSAGKSLKTCIQSLRILNETFNYQATYCEPRRKIDVVQIILLLVLGLGSGILLERWRETKLQEG